ncbi:shikimate kinase [Nocardia puris]|uniref:Shikimate kinase n=1 Tax=Nocardia puris TaxID=208602 RepID=A0A366E1I2_9NOCA|nr:shikimate kinase [Nocardia puris]
MIVQTDPRAPRVVLVGPPGAGKSTIGRKLAKELGVDLYDTDAGIERETGRTIPEIFAADGEPEFRRIEERVVRRAILAERGVVSLGGGAVLSENTRALLRGRTVVYLEISVGEGLRRTGSSNQRPLLTGDDPGAKYRELMRKRRPLYREVASVRVRTDGRSPGRVVKMILDKLGVEPVAPEPTAQPAPESTPNPQGSSRSRARRRARARAAARRAAAANGEIVTPPEQPAPAPASTTAGTRRRRSRRRRSSSATVSAGLPESATPPSDSAVDRQKSTTSAEAHGSPQVAHTEHPTATPAPESGERSAVSPSSTGPSKRRGRRRAARSVGAPTSTQTSSAATESAGQSATSAAEPVDISIANGTLEPDTAHAQHSRLANVAPSGNRHSPADEPRTSPPRTTGAPAGSHPDARAVSAEVPRDTADLPAAPGGLPAPIGSARAETHPDAAPSAGVPRGTADQSGNLPTRIGDAQNGTPPGATSAQPGGPADTLNGSAPGAQEHSGAAPESTTGESGKAVGWATAEQVAGRSRRRRARRPRGRALEQTARTESEQQ